jgi:hypothetical protein
MKSPADIADSIAQTIAGIYLRPAMHLGNAHAPHAAYSADILLWHLHALWVEASDESVDFRSAVDEVRSACECSNLHFTDAFRSQNPKATGRECSRHVIRQWKKISGKLGVPLLDSTGRQVTDADL